MADQQLAELHAAKGRLLASFTSTPYPPTGLATSDQALANAVELLEWCTALTADAVRERADLSDASPSARRLLGAASTALRDAASALGGGPARPDVDALIRGRDEALAVLDHLQDSPEGFRPAAQVSFHAHAISLAVLGIAAEILVAARLVDPSGSSRGDGAGTPRRMRPHAPLAACPAWSPLRTPTPPYARSDSSTACAGR